MQKMELYDPSFNVKKCLECFCKITGDAELLPQEHANNNASEMVFHEFVQLLMRTARIKSTNPKVSPHSCAPRAPARFVAWPAW
jgi:hypothetical protein